MSLSYRVSHSRGWCEVSIPFVLGFVAKTQDPISSAPRFEGFTVPAVPNVSTIAMGDCWVQCGRSGLSLDLSTPHRPRCEQLFFPAGRSMKEIALNTVSFWLWTTISRSYQLSGRPLLGPPLRARKPLCIAPSLLFEKNFAVAQVLKAGTWRKHTTFLLHYLWDLALRSLETFHLGHVVPAQAMVCPWPFAQTYLPLTDSWLTVDSFVFSPAIHRCPLRCPCSKVGIHHLCFHFSSRSFWLTLLWCPIPLRGILTLVILGFFFLTTAPSILLPGLGSKEGWEQAPSHVALRLIPLGSWLQIPNTRLSGRPPAGHQPSSAWICWFIPKVSILLEQLMFLSS